MASVKRQIQLIDRELLKFVGLATDPQARPLANRLLDHRLELMQERDGQAMASRRANGRL